MSTGVCIFFGVKETVSNANGHNLVVVIPAAIILVGSLQNSMACVLRGEASKARAIAVEASVLKIVDILYILVL